MKKAQKQVQEFMRKTGQHIPKISIWYPSDKERNLRKKLIREECKELFKGIDDGNIPEIYDGILDLLYVTIGTAITYGLDIQPGWEEVHRSNMSKLKDGKLRKDGKFIKGPSFTPPNLIKVLREMIKVS